MPHSPLVQLVPPILPKPVPVGEALSSALVCSTHTNMLFCVRWGHTLQLTHCRLTVENGSDVTVVTIMLLLIERCCVGISLWNLAAALTHTQSSCCCPGCVCQLCVMGSAEGTRSLSNNSRTTSSPASIRRYLLLGDAFKPYVLSKPKGIEFVMMI